MATCDLTPLLCVVFRLKWEYVAGGMPRFGREAKKPLAFSTVPVPVLSKSGCTGTGTEPVLSYTDEPCTGTGTVLLVC